MPGGISGLQLARHLKADKPALQVVYTSGYSAEMAGKDLTLKDGVNYLAKPYEIGLLLPHGACGVGPRAKQISDRRPVSG